MKITHSSVLVAAFLLSAFVGYAASPVANPPENGRKEIIVAGEVRAPGVYFFSKERIATPILAVSLAGSFTDRSDGHHVVVTHIAPDGRKSTNVVDIQAQYEGKDAEEKFQILQNGDIVYVPARKGEKS